MVIDRFGGADELHLADIERPVAGRGQVVIEVAYAGVNPADWKAREGWLAGYFDYRFPFVVGFDAAGIVAETGPGVEGVRIGDRVVTSSNQGLGERGTYAQLVRSDVDRVALLPAHVSLARAACLPTAAITAWEALFDVGQLKPGHKVLIHGGAGGTGSFAICLAAAHGASIAATCGPDNLEYLQRLSVKCPINYRTADVASAVAAFAPDGLDLIIDTVGQGTLPRGVEWVRRGGTVASIATLIAGEPQIDPASAAARGVQLVPTMANFERQGRQLRALVERLATGQFDAIALQTVPFAQAGAAHRAVQAGHVRGKIVLTVNSTI